MKILFYKMIRSRFGPERIKKKRGGFRRPSPRISTSRGMPCPPPAGTSSSAIPGAGVEYICMGKANSDPTEKSIRQTSATVRRKLLDRCSELHVDEQAYHLMNKACT